MADKKQESLDEVSRSAAEFNKATFELGLELIKDFRAGRCRDAGKTLDAIIEIFKTQPRRG